MRHKDGGLHKTMALRLNSARRDQASSDVWGQSLSGKLAALAISLELVQEPNSHGLREGFQKSKGQFTEGRTYRRTDTRTDGHTDGRTWRFYD